MTTIAFKDGILAADSRAMCNNWISHESAEKILLETHPVHGKMLFAISGDYVEGRHALAAIFAREKYVPQHNETFFTVLGVTPQGVLRVWCVGETHTDGEVVLAPFYAIGSGRVPAMAAMHAGATAVEAVEIAKKLDPNTGGEVRSYTITKTILPDSTRCEVKTNWDGRKMAYPVHEGQHVPLGDFMITKSQEHDLKRDRFTAQEEEILAIYDSWVVDDDPRGSGADAFSLTAMQTNTSAEYVRRLLKKRVALQLRAKAMGSK